MRRRARRLRTVHRRPDCSGILTVVLWIFLASPNIGLLNKAAGSLGFDAPPFNIFSLGGMIWVSIWQYLPMAFLLMSAAFQSMDPNLEEASAMSGHGVVRTTLRVTLPLTLPSILAVLVLLLISGLEAFETPALLGLSGKVLVFSTLVYLNTSFAPSDIGLASAYAVFMLMTSILFLACYLRITGASARLRRSPAKAFARGASAWGTGGWWRRPSRFLSSRRCRAAAARACLGVVFAIFSTAVTGSASARETRQL